MLTPINNERRGNMNDKTALQVENFIAGVIIGACLGMASYCAFEIAGYLV